VPGINTTAFALLKIFYNKLYSIKEYFFYEIEDVILDNEADAGLIIHESRFTYQQKGLKLVIDLGKLWHQKFNLPLPLGIFAVKRTLDNNTKLKINELIKESILFAFKNPHISYKFVIENAQVKDTQVITNHISLYVNDYSVNMGEIGKKSIYTFFEEANKIDLINNNFKTQSVFVS
jgi:1,4-dihydroxy-6-naphthoate synthase